MAKLSIDQHPLPAPIETGRLRILEAALDAGVPYPHGCGSGECGSCKSELLEGDVEHDRCSPDALSAEEQARGLILACRARATSNVRVRWLSDTAPLPMVKLDLKVAAIGRLAHDVVGLTLALGAGQRLNFRPGQFVKLRFGKLPARSYSPASQPGEDTLRFHVRVVPEGLVSGRIASGLRAGDTVEVRGPFGEAFWSPEHDNVSGSRILLVAGGTGMAPMVSVLQAMLAAGVSGHRIHVYHGVRAERDLYALPLLQPLAERHGLRLVPVLSQTPAAGLRFGQVHEAVRHDFQDLRGALVYTAGPPPMVEAVSEVAQDLGVAVQRIRTDPFTAAEPAKRSLWERITAWGGLD